jgi:hypothetical protein
VRGSLSNHSRGSSLEFDQATLQATISEPSVERDIRLTGIPCTSSG